MTPAEFKTKVAYANDLDFGTIFSQSIELFKKSWLQGFLMQLIVLILVLPFIIILYVPIIMVFISQSKSGEYNPDAMNNLFAGLSVIYVIFFFVTILVIATVQTAIYTAFFRILKGLDKGREVKTSELFYFMKGKYLGKIFLLMILTLLIALPAALFFYLPFIYVIVPISFFSIIFAFNPEWSVIDVIASGFRLGNKKWLLTFGLLLLCYVLLIVTIPLTCGLGSLFLTPFIYHPLYYIYKDTIGIDEVSELDQIGEGERS